MIAFAAAATVSGLEPGKRRIRMASTFCRSSMVPSALVHASKDSAHEQRDADQPDHDADRQHDHRHPEGQPDDHQHEAEHDRRRVLEESCEAAPKMPGRYRVCHGAPLLTGTWSDGKPDARFSAA